MYILNRIWSRWSSFRLPIHGNHWERETQLSNPPTWTSVQDAHHPSYKSTGIIESAKRNSQILQRENLFKMLIIKIGYLAKSSSTWPAPLQTNVLPLTPQSDMNARNCDTTAKASLHSTTPCTRVPLSRSHRHEPWEHVAMDVGQKTLPHHPTALAHDHH